MERYHNYLQLLIDNYFVDGKFEQKIETLDTLISDYVKNDLTAFCTHEEYITAVSAFITLGNLRTDSVQGQLGGTIPSTTTGQDANTEHLISAGDLKLSDFGSMMGGNGGFPGGMDNGNFGGRGPNNGQRIPPNINSEFNFSREQGSNKNNFIFIGALSLVLIGAILFASKFKKSY